MKRPFAIALGSKVFVQRLGLDPSHEQHVIPCVFHPDSSTSSLSVDLKKGVFYCFGACDEPKGGGIVDFIIKWARVKEDKTLTRAEAASQITRLYPTRSAQAWRRELIREEVELFRRYRSGVYADAYRETTRTLEWLSSITMRKELHDDSPIWTLFANLYRDASDFGYASEIMTSSRALTPAMLTVFQDARRRGWWDSLRDVETFTRVESELKLRRRQDIHSCHELPSISKVDPLTLKRPKQPVPLSRRQPVR